MDEYEVVVSARVVKRLTIAARTEEEAAEIAKENFEGDGGLVIDVQDIFVEDIENCGIVLHSV